MTPEQEKRLETLEALLFAIIRSDSYTFESHIKLLGGSDLALDGTIGSKIGRTAIQKLAFWGATPIVQPSSNGEQNGFSNGLGTLVKHDAVFTGAIGSTGYTISDIVKHQKEAGLIAL